MLAASGETLPGAGGGGPYDPSRPTVAARGSTVAAGGGGGRERVGGAGGGGSGFGSACIGGAGDAMSSVPLGPPALRAEGAPIGCTGGGCGAASAIGGAGLVGACGCGAVGSDAGDGASVTFGAPHAAQNFPEPISDSPHFEQFAIVAASSHVVVIAPTCEHDRVERPYRQATEPSRAALDAIAVPDDPDATFHCAPCALYFARGDLKAVPAGSGVLWTCPRCDYAVREERSRVVLPFHEIIRGAFRYPFQSEALVAIVGLGLVNWVLTFVIGGGTLIAAGLVATYFLEVVRSTAAGSDHAPMPTDYVDAGDLVRPMWRTFLAAAIAIAPAILLGVYVHPAAGLVYLALGAVYLPGGLVIAAHSDGWLSPANVPNAIRLAARIGRPYILVAALLATLGPLAIYMWLELTARAPSLPVPFVPAIAANIVTLFLPIILARILGLLVREHLPEI